MSRLPSRAPSRPARRRARGGGGDDATRPAAPRGESRSICFVLLVCLAAQVVVGILLARLGGFWSPDSAVRFVQVQSFLASPDHGVAVPYPAIALDPEGRYFPIGGWFHFGYAGRFYLSYLPYFSVVSAPLYRLLRWPGLLVIPSAAALGTVWITYGVLRRRVPDLAAAGALALGLATPIFIYGVVFWDHSLAACLGAGALAILSAEAEAGVPRGWWIAAGGSLLGLGCWVRNEFYALAAAAAVGWLCGAARMRLRDLMTMALGMALPAGGLWAVNTRLFGSPFGWKSGDLAATRIHAVADATARGAAGTWAWVVERLGNGYYQLASPDFYAFNPRAVLTGAALTLALVLAGVLLRAGVRRRSASLIATGAAVGVGTSLFVVSGRTMVSGLLPAAPLVVLALLTSPVRPWERFLWVTCGAFTFAVIVAGTHGGLQWGPRYLLPVIPPLVWMAAAAVARGRVTALEVWPALKLGAVALVVASLLVQAGGIDQVWQASSRNAGINRWMRSISAQIVVTPLEWLTLGAGPVYFDKELMLVRTPQDLRALVQRLSAQHVPRWAYIPFSGYGFNPLGVAAWTDRQPWRFQPVSDSSYEGLRVVTYVRAASSADRFPAHPETAEPGTP